MAGGSNGSSFVIGFVLGFFGGCFGIVVAALIKQDYLPGAVAGLIAATAFGCLLVGMVGLVPVMMSAPGGDHIEEIRFLDGTPTGPDIPWELVIALGVGSLIVAGGLGGALLILQRDRANDDGDVPPAPPVPPDQDYVSFR